VVDFAFKVLNHFDFKDIKIYASFSDPKSDKYVGDKKMWEQAEDTIREILKEKKIDYQEELGEAAFY
jgi:threonyl-tRNA synthetase